MSLNIANTVSEFLKVRPDEKFTARQMAEWIFEAHPEECRKKRDSSQNKFIAGANSDSERDNALVNALVAEIGARRSYIQKQTPQVKTTEGRPRKYYYTLKSSQDELSQAEQEGVANDADLAVNPSRLKEHDLYPRLAKYLAIEYKESVYAKRIDEKCSSNNRGPNGNRWLYPDVVALEDLTAEWEQEIKDCVAEYGDKKSRLWSFEVKLLINRSNVRDAYFQAVSNSSWANLGYLVAAEIEGMDTMKELRMLSALHGIGFIKLDADNPAESQIMIPAREQAAIEWDTANRLAFENKDFLGFIKLVKEFYQTGNPRKSEWGIA